MAADSLLLSLVGAVITAVDMQGEGLMSSSSLPKLPGDNPAAGDPSWESSPLFPSSAPPFFLPTPFRQTYSHSTSQLGASNYNKATKPGVVWKKVDKKPGLPDAHYWSVPSVSFAYRP